MITPALIGIRLGSISVEYGLSGMKRDIKPRSLSSIFCSNTGMDEAVSMTGQIIIGGLVFNEFAGSSGGRPF